MAEEQMLVNAAAYLLRRRHRRSRDEAIDDDRQPCCRGAETYTSHRRDFESADGSQHRESVVEACTMTAQRRFDHLDFVGECLVVNAGAPPRETRRFEAGNGSQNRGS